VSLRQIDQQVLPPIDINGNPLPPTPLWAYGDPARPATFNNPGFTIEVTKDVETTVTWKNELVDADGNYLPHIIQDQNGVPLVDQTLHWANPNGPVDGCADGTFRTDCRGKTSAPYTGPVPMVTHVHGAHVGPVSDGYPEAWWLPAAENIPDNYATEGTFYDDINGGAPGQGFAVYQYTNDQPTATLWYHDHSLGMTRLNVYAAGAGFWMIRNAKDGETGLVSGVLPGPAPLAGQDPNGNPAVRNAIREIPLAIQPKSFNADGTQYYPANRAFFEGLGTGGIYADNTGINMPFLPQGTSDIAPVWNPEAFFNTMVVNGNTWPQLEVAPERYRFRFVNASDSRFLNLSLRKGSNNSNAEIPFYVIGSEQGLLPKVVRVETGFATPLPGDGRDVCPGKSGKKGNRKNCVSPVPGTFAEQALLMGPAERPDVIVDFSGLSDGDQIVMVNTGPDAPFGGFPDVPADPATTGQVMKFVVNSALATPGGDPSTPAPSIVLDTNPGGVPKLGSPDAVQDLALLEEESAKICINIDPVTGVIDQVTDSVPPQCAGGGVPFAPKAAVLGTNGFGGGTPQLWSDPIQQNPALNSVEEWELWNWSADAHPIHLHLVKFEVVNREIIGGAVRPPEPWEAGWKDTVIAYPGEVTRVKALFDLEGLYVWHCHILSHEDNEMMVPYYVGNPANSPVLIAAP
jgi:FtsP/CotA-like multicopper oxidase with cupredoxin domain